MGCPLRLRRSDEDDGYVTRLASAMEPSGRFRATYATAQTPGFAIGGLAVGVDVLRGDVDAGNGNERRY